MEKEEEEEEKRERQAKRSDLLSTPKERERERSEGTGHGVDVYGARWLADRLNLTPIGDKGQREGWEVRTWYVGFNFFCFRVHHKINSIGKSNI